MLRFLENGIKVKMIKTNHFSQSVDNNKDLLKVCSYLKNNEKNL